MAGNDIIKKSGAPKMYQDDSGGAVLIQHPVIGIVKDNIDPTHSGRIKVYINKFGGPDPDDSANWRTVSYLSPWYGVIAPKYDVFEGEKSGYGKYVGNPHSYGFWATAPDLGTTVICVFVNGDSQDGYYIGCVPKPGLHHMVPAVAATSKIVPNKDEATTYGGADRLPVTEVNYANPAIRNSPSIYSEPKPVHSYQAGLLAKQGLIRDNLRGVISSSSQRETPSKVFGMSTPGRPIYSGGHTNATITSAIKTAKNESMQLLGRTGGHSIVMDDGKTNGEDQLFRIRTAAGHMIMMNDSGQNLFIIHSNGQSWIELGKEGTIDMFSTNSVNIRTQGDLNLHADQDINIHAKRNLNMFAENIKTEADKNITQRSGQDYYGYHKGIYTVQVDREMSLASNGDSSFLSKSINYLNGRKIHLNTGASGTVPKPVVEIPKVNHVDTTYSQTVGWMNPSPDPLLSITTRTPAHAPWAEANKGVDVKTAPPQPITPPQPTAAVNAATSAAPATPATAASAAVAATAPTQPAAGPSTTTPSDKPTLPPATATAMTSQNAVDKASLTPAEKVSQGVVGEAGATLAQLNAPGQALKPGSSDLTQQIQAMDPNIPMAVAASNVLTTGHQGVGSPENLAKNVTAQLSAVSNSFDTASKQLTQSGILTGQEAPTQVAGVVLAAANVGVAQVTAALKNPSAIASQISSGAADIGKNIASGNFAAGLADKVASGLGGVASSLSDMASGLATGLSSGLANVSGGINSLINNLAGAAKNAYAAAEKSFGELKAGEPNALGGLPANSATEAVSEMRKTADESKRLEEEIAAATEEKRRAIRDQEAEFSSENLAKIHAADARLNEANRKYFAHTDKVLRQLNPSLAASVSAPSAQGLASAAVAAASGMLTAATTKNSGINGLPGGLGAYANQVSAASSNVVGAVKSMAAAAGAALSNPASLAGNLVNNVQAAVTGQAGKAAAALTSAVGALSSPAGAVSNLLGGIKNSASGLFSQMNSALGSLGNAPGQIKQAILANDTFAAAAAISAKTGKLLGDTRVPNPTFDEITPTVTPDEYQEQQVQAQNQLEDLLAERANIKLTIGILMDEYYETENPELLIRADIENDKIADIDLQIVGAQANYESIVNNK